MSIAAGKFDRLVQFERDLLDLENRTGIEPDTITQKTVKRWAKVKSVKAKDRLLTLQKDSRQSIAIRAVVIVCLWLDDITNGDRFTMEGRTYEITGVAEIGRRELVEVMGEEVERGQ
jgi:head-tail adaptor